jgi:glutaconate CoA-transferase subunit B
MSVIGPFDSPRVRLPGGAGSAAIMPRARRTLLWRTKHDRRVFVDKLDFVTAAGHVDRVVTPLCVFQRRDGQLIVEFRHPWVSPKQLIDATGFSVVVDDATPITPAPTSAERECLARIDSDGVTLTEF